MVGNCVACTMFYRRMASVAQSHQHVDCVHLVIFIRRNSMIPSPVGKAVACQLTIPDRTHDLQYGLLVNGDITVFQGLCSCVLSRSGLT